MLKYSLRPAYLFLFCSAVVMTAFESGVGSWGVGGWWWSSWGTSGCGGGSTGAESTPEPIAPATLYSSIHHAPVTPQRHRLSISSATCRHPDLQSPRSRSTSATPPSPVNAALSDSFVSLLIRHSREKRVRGSSYGENKKRFGSGSSPWQRFAISPLRKAF